MKPSSEPPQFMRVSLGRRWRQTLRSRLRPKPAQTQADWAGPLTLCDYIATLSPTAQTLSEALCALDLTGRIQFVNQRFAQAMARAEIELVGMNVTDLIHCSPESAAIISTSAWPASAARASAPLDLSSALPLGALVEFSACSLRLPDGTLSDQWRCSLCPIDFGGRALGYTLIAQPAANSSADATVVARDEPGGSTEQIARRQALEAEMARVEQRLRVVEAVSDIALAHLPLDALLQALLEGMRREMRLENIAIFLISDDGNAIVAHVVRGAGAEFADQVRVPLGQSVVGQVMTTRRPILISRPEDLDEVLAPTAYFTRQMRASMSLGSLVIVPLIVEERVIGALHIGASESNRFNQDDLRLVEMVGERVALAIERTRASDDAAQAHERLRFLSDASMALTATLDYRDTARRLGAILTPALAEAIAIYLVEEDGLLRKAVARAPSAGALTSDPVDDALRQIIERQAQTIEVSHDDTTDAIARCVHTLTPIFERQFLAGALSPDQDGHPGVAEGAEVEAQAPCLAVPLVMRQHALGAIYLIRRPGKDFAADDLALIQGLAERAAIAIDNARLYIETQQALATGSATATQLDTIFNATDVGIFVTDAEGVFLRVNPYGAHMLGLEPSDFASVHEVADPTFELRTPEGDPLPLDCNLLSQARRTGQPVEQRLIIHRSDTGRDIEALMRCTPWRDRRGQVAGAIGVLTDITAISRLERQKDEFLGVASHELKTPLTSLKILAQMLRRKLEASGDARELAQAQRMQVSITRMERLISDLLDVTLIQEGKLALNRELTDLREICAEAIEEQETLTQRVIRCNIAKDATLLIYADRERIYQAVTNLLSNALKYSLETEPVELRAYATATTCVVAVKDHGPGIPPEEKQHIFDRFFRVPGMQVQSGSGVGLGLGLHITKEIVERHGGHIEVDSTLGHGSVFWFELPRANQTPASPQP